MRPAPHLTCCARDATSSQGDLLAFARGKYVEASSRPFSPRPTWVDTAYMLLVRRSVSLKSSRP